MLPARFLHPTQHSATNDKNGYNYNLRKRCLHDKDPLATTGMIKSGDLERRIKHFDDFQLVRVRLVTR
jgi:hypothetical protein